MIFGKFAVRAVTKFSNTLFLICSTLTTTKDTHAPKNLAYVYDMR